LFVLGLLAACRTAPVASGGDPGVVPPGARVFGKSYGEWSAAWWQFVYSIPKSDNPLLRDDRCEARQSGPVWFLTAKWGDSPVIATRHCTVPFGTYLFFPIVNMGSNNVGVSPPHSVDELLAEARQNLDTVMNTRCWVDGREIRGLSPAVNSPYRVASPVFRLKAPVDGVHGWPPNTIVPMVADGLYLMLEPLPAGRHTIRFTGDFLSANYSLDMKYDVDVAPRKK
jgi:hypothetical protein